PGRPGEPLDDAASTRIGQLRQYVRDGTRRALRTTTGRFGRDRRYGRQGNSPAGWGDVTGTVQRPGGSEVLHMRKKRSTSFAVALFTLLFSQAPEALANICNKWQPGHYIRIPVYNSGHQLVSKVLSKDLRNFKGIEYHFERGALEKSKGKI